MHDFNKPWRKGRVEISNGIKLGFDDAELILNIVSPPS